MENTPRYWEIFDDIYRNQTPVDRTKLIEDHEKLIASVLRNSKSLSETLWENISPVFDSGIIYK